MKITVDAVVFAYFEKKIHVLLIKRAFEPFMHYWALPGGFVNDDETTEQAVIRKLKEETNISLDYIEQLYTFSAIDRDPRERILSVSYYALINPNECNLTTNIHAKELMWFAVNEISQLSFAFDHYDIIRYARERLKNKIVYEPIGFGLLPKYFTMTELYDLYRAILDKPNLDQRNFVRKINNYNLLKPTKMMTEGHVGRRAKMFEFNKMKYNQLKAKGFSFDLI